eukprot:PITA_06663
MPLVPQVTLQAFDKWAIDFVRPITPLGRRTGARYIITMIDYMTRWAEAQPVRDCNANIVAKFIFEYIFSRFGCLKILMSDQGSHFLNKTIEALTEEFQVYHHKGTPYYPQANGIVEEFNNILENALTKEDIQQKKQQLEEIWEIAKTLPISQKIASINEGNSLQKKIEELRKKDNILTERSQPWQDEALQLSQAVDENLQELRQREKTMVQKATKHVTKSLLDEVRSEEKWVTKILQQFNNSYNIIKAKTKGEMDE